MPDNGIYSWNATTPLSNGNADAAINWQENMAPSLVNNSARAMMQREAQRLIDTGYPTAGGGADALTLTPLNVLTSYTSGMVYTFTAASTNTTNATLNISGVGIKAIRKISGGVDVALTAGDIATGSRYEVVYDSTANAAAGAWILTGSSGFNGTLTSTDAGATAAPILTLYRDSATPATNDVLGQLLFNGEDSAGNTQEYASIQAVIADPVSGSEDGTLDFYLPVAGSRTKVLSITGSAIATAAEWRTGTSTTKLLGVSETWGAAAWVNLGASLTGNLTIDFATGINFYGTATGNITFNAVSNAKEQSGEFMITASGGDRTVSFNTTPYATPNNASLGTITSATTMLFSYTRAQNGKFVISAIGTVS